MTICFLQTTLEKVHLWPYVEDQQAMAESEGAGLAVTFDL
jgi:hypothetical protein